MTKYGVCDCGMWGEAPKEFKESVHFLKCSHCGSAMYLTILDPREAGYREEKKITLTLMKHGVKL